MVSQLATYQQGADSIPVVLANDTRADLHHGCSRVMDTIEHLVRSNGMHVIGTVAVNQDWRNDPAFSESMRRARMVIVNGEGTIHHDARAGELLLALGAEAKRLNIASALINASWEANGSDFARKLAAFDLVAVRESLSADEVRKYGVSCRVVPDMSTYWPGPVRRAREHIGFSDSVVRDVASKLSVLRRRVGGLETPIVYARRGPTGLFRFLRSYVGKNDLQDPLRLSALLRLRIEQYLAQTDSVDAYLERVSSLRVLVTGRFHAVAMALVCGTPFLAVETNTHKIRGLIEDAGLDPCRLTSSNDLCAATITTASEWRGDEREKLDDYLLRGRAAIGMLFRDLGSLAR